MSAIHRWGPKHDRAVQAMLVSPSIKAAAARVGISERTLRRWMDEAIFADRLDMAQRESRDKALGSLQALTTQAVGAVARALRCGQPMAELKAAGMVLELADRRRAAEHLTDPTVSQIDLWLARVERRLAQGGELDRDLWEVERDLWTGT